MAALSKEVDIVELRAVVRAVRAPASSRGRAAVHRRSALAALVIFAGIAGILHSASFHAWSSWPGRPWRQTEELTMRAGLLGRMVVGSSAVVFWGVVCAQDAPPTGYVLIADSTAGFSSVQGANGWWYRFDRGTGTVAESMQHFVYSFGADRWCATPIYGLNSTSPESSFCMLSNTDCHTNTGAGCEAPAQGLLRPIREWRADVAQAMKVHVTIEAAQVFVQEFELLVDGVAVWSLICPPEIPSSAGVLLDVPSGSVVALRTSPLGFCTGSRHRLRIFARDCNSDGLSDAQQIQDGQLLDQNANGIPDCCEQSIPCDPCPADIDESGTVSGVDLAALLGVWNTDGGKYPRADIDGSGTVDAGDLAILLNSWGACP